LTGEGAGGVNLRVLSPLTSILSRGGARRTFGVYFLTNGLLKIFYPIPIPKEKKNSWKVFL
jgi:hypothetical protein